LQYCIRRCSLQVMENHHLSVEKYWSHFDFIIHRDCTSFSTLSIMNMKLLQSTPYPEQTYSFAILFRFVQVQWQDEKSPVRLLVIWSRLWATLPRPWLPLLLSQRKKKAIWRRSFNSESSFFTFAAFVLTFFSSTNTRMHYLTKTINEIHLKMCALQSASCLTGEV
jgi:hypothetical protein